MENNFSAYSEILEDIQRRNSDWEDMSNGDRYVVKMALLQLIRELEEKVQGIEHWESIYGRVDNNLNLQ